MLNYQTLDAIADAVNPVGGVLALVLPWLRSRTRGRRAFIMDLLTLAAVGLAYAVRALDSSFLLWGRLGLDYSTHAAVYIAIASSLWQQGGMARLTGVIVGAAYAGLMLWQKYHSLSDIVTTAVVMALVLTAFWWTVRRVRLVTAAPARQ